MKTREELDALKIALQETLPGETLFDRYQVTLTADVDYNDPARGAWIDCEITHPDGSCNTLGWLEGEGEFMDNGETISERVLDRIRAHAENYGY